MAIRVSRYDEESETVRYAPVGGDYSDTVSLTFNMWSYGEVIIGQHRNKSMTRDHPQQVRLSPKRVEAALATVLPVLAGREDAAIHDSWRHGRGQATKDGDNHLRAWHDSDGWIYLHGGGNYALRPGRGRDWTRLRLSRLQAKLIAADLAAWAAGGDFQDFEFGLRGGLAEQGPQHCESLASVLGAARRSVAALSA